eukprot:g82391.t1
MPWTKCFYEIWKTEALRKGSSLPEVLTSVVRLGSSPKMHPMIRTCCINKNKYVGHDGKTVQREALEAAEALRQLTRQLHAPISISARSFLDATGLPGLWALFKMGLLRNASILQKAANATDLWRCLTNKEQSAWTSI